MSGDNDNDCGFTPGSWFLDRRVPEVGNVNSVDVFAVGGELVINLFSESTFSDVDIANISLLVAAPKLANALREIVAAWDGGKEAEVMVVIARAALAEVSPQ